MTTEFKNIPTNVKITFTLHNSTALSLKNVVSLDDEFILLFLQGYIVLRLSLDKRNVRFLQSIALLIHADENICRKGRQHKRYPRSDNNDYIQINIIGS